MNTNNKFLTFSLLLFISPYIVNVGFCQDLHGQQIGDTPLTSMPCVQKLIPCQPYLASSASPPDSCCSPLRELIESPGQTRCLCYILNNPSFMNTFNVTKDGALRLARECGSSAGESLCVRGPKSPCAPTTPYDDNDNNDSPPGYNPTATRHPKKNAAGNGISGSNGFCSIMIASVLMMVSGLF